VIILTAKKIATWIALTLILSGCSIRPNKATLEANKVESVIVSANINEDTKLVEKLPETIMDTSSDVARPIEIEMNDRTKETKPQIIEKVFTPVLEEASRLDKKEVGWSWKYSLKKYKNMLVKYNGYGDGDTSKKIIYLTFDEGYENGNTPTILDVLKANNVKAAFFVTSPYVTSSYKGIKGSDLVKRMVDEGHIVANHSVHHKSMPTFIDEASHNAELKGVEDLVNSIPGAKMSKYFRPPMGKFSELSLYYTQKMGYKSIFFNLAYNDYEVDKQPDPVVAKNTLLRDSSPGMICLLHAISNTNTAILDSLIKEWKNQGYEFKTLDDLPQNEI
jgi:peptidoglycan-N-acetylmuramic acid deacetylase